MDIFSALLARVNGGGASAGGILYNEVTYADNDTVLLKDTLGKTHEMKCTYNENKIEKVLFDGQEIDIGYEGDTLNNINGISIDLSKAPLAPSGGGAEPELFYDFGKVTFMKYEDITGEPAEDDFLKRLRMGMLTSVPEEPFDKKSFYTLNFNGDEYTCCAIEDYQLANDIRDELPFVFRLNEGGILCIAPDENSIVGEYDVKLYKKESSLKSYQVEIDGDFKSLTISSNDFVDVEQRIVLTISVGTSQLYRAGIDVSIFGTYPWYWCGTYNISVDTPELESAIKENKELTISITDGNFSYTYPPTAPVEYVYDGEIIYILGKNFIMNEYVSS